MTYVDNPLSIKSFFFLLLLMLTGSHFRTAEFNIFILILLNSYAELVSPSENRSLEESNSLQKDGVTNLDGDDFEQEMIHEVWENAAKVSTMLLLINIIGFGSSAFFVEVDVFM